MVAVRRSSQPNPQRNKRKWKIYAIKQIKICAEYREMLPRPRLDLSCTHGLPSTDSWQTSLGLGNMSWYSAHTLICIIKPVVLISWFGNWERFLRWKHRHLRVFHPMLSISSYTKSLKTGLANGSALTITGYCSELLVVQNTTSHGYLDMGAFKKTLMKSLIGELLNFHMWIKFTSINARYFEWNFNG